MTRSPDNGGLEDTAGRLSVLTGRQLLQGSGSVLMADAKAHAKSEYEKYRITQDRLYKSDFDKLIEESRKK